MANSELMDCKIIVYHLFEKSNNVVYLNWWFSVFYPTPLRFDNKVFQKQL